MSVNNTQPKASEDNLKNRRVTVEENVTPVKNSSSKFPKTHANFWRGRLRRQRYGSKKDGTYRELPSFYFRVYHQGREHAFTLQTLNETAAATQARDIYLSILREGWDSVLHRFHSDADAVAQNPTVGEFLEEVSAKAGLRDRTFRNYTNCFRTIVSEIFKIRSGGSKFDYHGKGNSDWRKKIDSVKLSKIKPDKVQAWKVARIKAAGDSPTAQRAAKRTVNTYIRCSRALFSRKICKYISIAIPEPTPFHGITLEQAGSMKYQSKINVADLVATARTELKESHPEPYKIFLLGLFAGLRRNEIDGLEWSAVDWANNEIRVANTEVLRLKSNESEGSVAVEGEVLEELKALHTEPEKQFVVEGVGHTRPNSELAYYRCQQHFDFLTKWLRQQGITANKPIHELRKELGALIVSKHGIYAASHMLRHSDISTTARHYADQKHRISAGIGNLLTKPVRSEKIEAHE